MDIYYENTPVRVRVDGGEETLTARHVASHIVEQIGEENLVVGPPGRDATITFGASAGTVCEGDDARLFDARTPRGSAAGAGHLAGTYPDSVTIAAGVVGLSTLHESVKPSGTAAATDEALRRLGSGVTEAAPGVTALHAVAHGATAGTARPAGVARVLWIGSVEPTNATRGVDLWLRTAA